MGGSFICLLIFGLVSEAYNGLIGPEIFVGAFGASTAVIFNSPKDRISSYKNLVLGYLVSCVIGLNCNYFIEPAIIKTACAVSLAIFVMRQNHIFHPAGGALAFLSATISYQSPIELLQYLLSTAIIGPSLFFLIVLIVRKILKLETHEIKLKD